MFRILAAALLILVATGAQAGQKRVCSQAEAMQAEEESDRLSDWPAVYRSFKRFAHCDDGAIWEGYSDSIARMLASRWEQLEDLRRLVVADKGFERFVLRHIDGLMTTEQQQLILENARARCPSNAKRLCGLIEKRAR